MLSSGLDNMRIFVIILNYNSEKDLFVCANQLSKQYGVHMSIIVVDNASRPESVARIKTWLGSWRPDAVCGTEDEVHTWVDQYPESTQQAGAVYFIENHANSGYSAGNNIGIRLADALQADAVLIANPDMRIEAPNYLAELSRHMFADSSNYVVASRIIGLDGIDQNPLQEASFWEELFWPRWLLRSFLRTKSYVLPCASDRTTVVPKVSGCCLLLRMDFLRSTNYLDEKIFLYCEEPILSARVHAAGGKILYVPMVSATHAHVRSEKGDGTKRMVLFIQSRKYYLNTYSGYNCWKLRLLFASYNVLAGYNRLKGFGKTLLQRGGRSCA